MTAAKGKHPPVPKWCDRNARLFGVEGVARLAAAHVMVIGLGGVGSYAVEGLARAGVGRLTLVDFDEVCVTNLNRQCHALPSTIGRSKAELMAERVRAINPGARVEAVHAFYEAKTAPAFLDRRPDVIVDAIDNITAKLHLLATCIFRAIPVVTALGASAKLDPTRVRVADLRKTHDDPLAKTIRKNLWRVYEINLKRVSHLHAIYSDEDVILPDPSYRSSLCGFECACPNQANQHHTCARRRIIYGTAVFVTSVFGMTAAGLVTRFLAGDARIDLRPTFKVLDGDAPLRDPDERWREGSLVAPDDPDSPYPPQEVGGRDAVGP